MDIKFNPFNPHGMVSPGMFQGRTGAIQIAAQSLFQAKNGNPQHLLYLGERGIGKSSVLLAVETLAVKGFEDPVFGDMDFICVFVDLGGCNSQMDIVRAIAIEFRNQLSEHQALRESAGKVWEWITNWEVLGVRYNKHPEEFDSADAVSRLVAGLAEFCAATRKDGILILIDEADRPADTAHLGELLKLLTERLARKRCDRVLFVLAGLPSLLPKLRESHGSAPRIFRIVDLPVLDQGDSREVIRAGLTLANKRNARPTQIDDDALTMIIEISEGYPHFIQQFAFSAFDVDTDSLIDVKDVQRGAEDALKQLGEKYFSDIYQTRTQSADYRRVLDAMAGHSDSWIAKQQIIRESGVKETTMNNALRALKARGAIVVDEMRPGFYKMATKSFAAWINAVHVTMPVAGGGAAELED